MFIDIIILNCPLNYLKDDEKSIESFVAPRKGLTKNQDFFPETQPKSEVNLL